MGTEDSDKDAFADAFDEFAAPPHELIVRNFEIRYNKTRLRFEALTRSLIKRRNFLRGRGDACDCLYLFFDPAGSLESVYDAKQLFFQAVLSLPLGAPLCIVFGARGDRARELSFEDVERIFQLGCLIGLYPILFVRLRLDVIVTAKVLFEWTAKTDRHRPSPGSH